MAAVAAELDGQVNFIGVGGGDGASAMQGFVDEFDVGFFPQIADESGAVWSSFGVTGQPSFAFINDDGSIELHRGGLSEDGIRAAAEALASR